MSSELSFGLYLEFPHSNFGSVPVHDINKLKFFVEKKEYCKPAVIKRPEFMLHVASNEKYMLLCSS
jgi:hypothetical protein